MTEFPKIFSELIYDVHSSSCGVILIANSLFSNQQKINYVAHCDIDIWFLSQYYCYFYIIYENNFIIIQKWKQYLFPVVFMDSHPKFFKSKYLTSFGIHSNINTLLLNLFVLKHRYAVFYVLKHRYAVFYEYNNLSWLALIVQIEPIKNTIPIEIFLFY